MPHVASPQFLTEDDLALANALQIAPRASWQTIAKVLRVDESTLTRRWTSLTERRLAWITPALGPSLMELMTRVFLEVQCEPRLINEVAQKLSEEPHVLTVYRIAGAYDLFAICFSSDFTAMSDYLLTALPRYEGVVRVRSHFVTRNYATGSQWRLNSLSRAQIHALRQSQESDTEYPEPAYGRWERDLIRVLSSNGRRSYQDIAQELDLDPRTVKRRLEALIAAKALMLRCDVARPLAGWPTGAILSLKVPDEALDQAGQIIGAEPETRSCAAVSSANNLLVTTTLHSVDELHQWTARLRTLVPSAQVEDRAVIMQTTKLIGHILDPAGRSSQVVPVDVWRPPGFPSAEDLGSFPALNDQE
jgi:DNA-binding Lrp family transcriptional regulator